MHTPHKTPQITLVGAGPGDPELLTVKAVRALERADAVLYDALVGKEILELIPNTAIKVFVGKRKGICQYNQDEINELIVKHAHKYGHVVRLKGGDPFVFGRGAEEIDYAHQRGIATAVIPGLSSSITVPASKGIAVTKRGIAESFWVMTGTTKAHQLSEDVRIAAQSSATLVILMGVHRLHEIVPILQHAGKGQTPIAIIQNGTTPDEKIGVGVVDTIQAIVEAQQLASPAIIVVGEVVRESIQLQHFFGRIQELTNLEIQYPNRMVI
ncbi:MAG: Uroporphyrinogen-III C-methyltransferase [Bacteroidota bacterium]|jgi:uroporphyrin-III C-methyltransferase